MCSPHYSSHLSARLSQYIGICGQAPSDFPEMAEWLVTAGIESGISDLTMEQVRDRAHKSALERQRAHAG